MAWADWAVHIREMRKHVVRIATPNGGGIGFILHINRDEKTLVIATAGHVVRDAYAWMQDVKIFHDAFESPLRVAPGTEGILLHPRLDSACVRGELPAIREDIGEDAFPEEPIEHVPLDVAVAPAAAVAPLWAPAMRLALWPLALATHLVVARGGQPGDRTFRELRRARRKEQHRRDHEMADRRRAVEREAARQNKTRRAEAVRQEELRQRRERIEASDREKRDRRMAKERAKLQRTRVKRRAALVSQIKRRIGFGRTEGSSPPE